MAGKISELTAATSVAAADQVEVLQGGVNLRATMAMLGSYGRGLLTATPATIAEGGTGAATAAAARTALGVDTAISAAVAGLVNSSPAALDTLKELADALGDDANYAATVTTALAGKQAASGNLTTYAGIAPSANVQTLLGSASYLAFRASLGTPLAGSGSADPGTTTDSASGYAVGSRYFNTASETAWVCKDATASAAKWQKLTAGVFAGYISGRWVQPIEGATLAAGTAGINTFIALIPFFVYEKLTVAQLGCRIATTSASGKAMLGIYAHNYTTGKPTGNVLANVNDLSTTTGTTVSGALGANVALDPGLYWMGTQMDNATSAFVVPSGTVAWMSALLGSTSLSSIMSGSTNGYLCYTVTNTYGTWPDMTSATFVEGSASRAGLIALMVA